MIPRYILDTSIISNFLKRSSSSRTSNPKYPLLERQIEILLQSQELCISVVTMFELERGLLDLERQSKGQRKIARTRMFLQGVSILGLDAYDWHGWSVAAEIDASGKSQTPAVTIR